MPFSSHVNTYYILKIKVVDEDSVLESQFTGTIVTCINFLKLVSRKENAVRAETL